MNLKESIRPISYIKTHAADMLKRINDTQNPIVITQNGEARGVLLDTQSYQEMVDAIGVLKLLTQGERSIEAKLAGQTKLFVEISHADATLT